MMAIVLTTAFLSQSNYFESISKTFNYPIFKKGDAYSNKIKLIKVHSDPLKANLYASISGGLLSGEESLKNMYSHISTRVINEGAIVGNQIDYEKNNLEKSSWDGFKQYIANKVISVLGVQPQDLQSSPVPQNLEKYKCPN